MNERVLITGGADSVGRVMAERFAQRGDLVHICDINPQALQQTLAANPGMRGTLADVGDPSAVDRIFADAQWLGAVSVLVNNVGIGGARGAMEDIADTDWDQAIRVNLNGTFYCMKRAIPAMKRARHGVIINFSTGSTRTRLPMRAPYVASKFGVEGLTLNAARELGPHNIRCNAILPGMINNARMQGIVRSAAEKAGQTEAQIEAQYLQYISMRAKTELSELADMALFLASDGARKVTGELISVSGNVEWEF